MHIRELESKDAVYMIEWMHDDSIVEYMKQDFKSKSKDDCVAFIEQSINDKNNCHMAIVTDDDEYMGTVSLKNIHDRTAEFAITLRKCAMGHGYSQYGMAKIIRHGFENLQLELIYWSVRPDNKRAVRFYDKNGYYICNVDELLPNIDGGGTQQKKFIITVGTGLQRRNCKTIKYRPYASYFGVPLTRHENRR